MCLRVRINNRELLFEFIVLSHCSYDVILGWDFLEASPSRYRLWTNELVLEDICRDSTAPDAWNLIFTGDHAPINQRAYRVSPTERRIIHEEVQKMLDEGIVQPSESPWSSPIVLVPCSFHGSPIWLLANRNRRSGIVKRRHLLPPKAYTSLKSCRLVSCNAPATFERMMDNLLRHFKWTMCLCYLDDIIVFSETFEDHLIRLRLVLKCLQEAGLKLNSKKCLLLPKKFRYLAEPLQSLLKSGVEFHWGPEEVEAFNSLKKALTDPVLGMYDERASTEIHTDASGYGIGAVLVQIQNNVEKKL
ncbi:transposon Ty3-I Gag-Pol polyprotein [Trichonephila clavipes]|nr:transposon Ty3-I Gag-Pol polyprotein [Trichonephila clavipes]